MLIPCAYVDFWTPAWPLVIRIPAVERVQDLGRDAAQQLSGEDSQKRPGEIQGLVDVAGVVRSLAHKLALKLLQKLEVQLK